MNLNCQGLSLQDFGLSFWSRNR